MYQEAIKTRPLFKQSLVLVHAKLVTNDASEKGENLQVHVVY